jgi:hypothetical protein
MCRKDSATVRRDLQRLRHMILREGNAPLDVGPQPDYIGRDLSVIADQLIGKYGSGAGQ